MYDALIGGGAWLAIWTLAVLALCFDCARREQGRTVDWLAAYVTVVAFVQDQLLTHPEHKP